MTQGGRFAGYGLYLIDSTPVFHYNLGGVERYEVKGEALPSGEHVVTVDVVYDGGGFGKGADVTLSVDGNPVSRGRLDQTLAFRISLDETLDIGSDTGTPVSEDTSVPFDFTGEIGKVKITISDRTEFSEEELMEYRKTQAKTLISS